MSAQIVGQECLFDLPNTRQDKPIDSTAGHSFRRLPDDFAETEHSSDWWYGVEECIGCGTVADRKGLQVTHGVQFADEGTQHLPNGPGMAESGVCMLMLFTARHAQIARRIADGDPRVQGLEGRCFQHELRKSQCSTDCRGADALHKARLATRVWGSHAWSHRNWVG
jgi:hypothetical protein